MQGCIRQINVSYGEEQIAIQPRSVHNGQQKPQHACLFATYHAGAQVAMIRDPCRTPGQRLSGKQISTASLVLSHSLLYETERVPRTDSETTMKCPTYILNVSTIESSEHSMYIGRSVVLIAELGCIAK